MLKKNILLIVTIVILGYLIFRMESINNYYAESASFTKDEVTVENLESNINVGEVIKSDLLDLEDLYLSNLSYEVDFSYNENPNFFNEMKVGFLKNLVSPFVEKEYKIKLSSDLDLGIDFSLLEIKEDESNLKLIYNGDLLTDVDVLLNESILDKDLGLFRFDFSESDRALLIDTMINYTKDSVLNDTELVENFKVRVESYLYNKALQVQSVYGVDKDLSVEVNFVLD